MVRRATPRIASWKYAFLAYALIAIVGITDLFITLALPMDASHDKRMLRVIAAGTVVVQVGIWCIAVTSALRFMRYATGIKTTPDGKGMVDIARALWWLIGYIVVLPLIGSIAEHSASGGHAHELVLLRNYVPLLPMLVAVGYLYRGSRRLLGLVRIEVRQKGWQIRALVLFAVMAGLFTWHFYEVVPTLMPGSATPRFAQPVTVLLGTYVLPHLVLWFFGLLAIIHLWQYATRVEGSIYRRLFSNFYQGIALVFICTFISQLLLASAVTLSTLGVGVGLVYLILVLAIAGYVLIYRGVQQLVRLETDRYNNDAKVGR